jgi:hypothetical protein
MNKQNIWIFGAKEQSSKKVFMLSYKKNKHKTE